MTAKVTPPQNSFNAGELSPLIGARFDLAKYPNGCKTLENATPLVEGGAKKMPGTYYGGHSQRLTARPGLFPSVFLPYRIIFWNLEISTFDFIKTMVRL